MITILYQSAWPMGGGTSYTAHLVRVLGEDCRVVRIGNRTESFLRKVGDMGFEYQNLSFEDYLRIKDTPILMTMGNPKQDENQLIRMGQQSNLWCVLHDWNEFKQFKHWNHFSHERVILARECMKEYMPRGQHIEKPYVRQISSDFAAGLKRELACSVARTTGAKNSHWILDANRKLPKSRRVVLHGAWNRFWWNFSIKAKYPEYATPDTIHNGYERSLTAAPLICTNYKLMVDLSIFENNGGDLQYATLEAMDGGAVPVVTEDWCKYPGIAKNVSYRVRDTAALVALLKAPPSDSELAERRSKNWYVLDTRHAPRKIKEHFQFVLLRL